MNIPVRIEHWAGAPAPVDYRWDEDTDILTAQVEGAAGGRTLSVDVEGSDGSWLILDVSDEHIRGVEVAVWPTVQRRADLKPPAEIESVRVKVGRDGGATGFSAVEVDISVAAESDDAERTIHFRLGHGRQVRTVRIARDMLLDIDTRDRLAGVWLLQVPPFPTNQ
ncbi:MAG TPA: hypothetical protein VIK50_00360 [Gemmatimonadaceae bacterium]